MYMLHTASFFIQIIRAKCLSKSRVSYVTEMGMYMCTRIFTDKCPINKCVYTYGEECRDIHICSVCVHMVKEGGGRGGVHTLCRKRREEREKEKEMKCIISQAFSLQWNIYTHTCTCTCIVQSTWPWLRL